MSGTKLDVIVVGAGVFGISAALELRRRGHAVTVFDPGEVPRPEASSTDISKAIRADYGDDELYTAMMERAFPVWEAWNRSWQRPLFHQEGVLFLSRGEMQPGGFEHDSFQLLKRRGHRVERLDSPQLKRRFPEWTAELYPDGYYNPRAGWAESGEVVRRLAEQARAQGVALHERTGMKQLLENGSRVTGITDDRGGRHRADHVVVAAGAWTPSLLPELGRAMWAVGQPVLHFGTDDPARYRAPRYVTWCADVSNTGWYGFPAREDGTLKIANHGAGRRMHADEPHTVDPAEEPRFRRFLSESLPSLADAPLIGGRLCLYCDTWDGNFWIDHHPERPGLFVACGGSGHGFKFAPLLGGIVADGIEGKYNEYAARFRRRQPGTRSTERARHLPE